jgi:hypothetical protein
MQSSMLKAITEDFGNGGTIDGDLTISGDLTVSGGGSLSFDEIIEGTSTIKVTNTSAFLIEKADGSDVFVVDSTNTRVGVGIAPTEGTFHVHTATAGSVSAHGDADDLVVENSASGGISILTPDSGYGALFFGSPSDSIGAQVSYRQSSTEMLIGTRLSGGILKLRTADGVDAVTIDASQNVGIGIASPDGTLHSHSGSAGSVSASAGALEGVFENSGDAGITLLSPDASFTNVIFGSASDSIGAQLKWKHDNDLFRIGTANAGASLAFETANTVEAMRIDSSGNVGIGTASPMNKTQINHNGSDGDNALMLVNENTTIAADACLGIIGFDSADGNVPSSGYEASGYIAVIASENHSATEKGGHILFGTTADNDDDDTGSHERMRLTSAGNLGIGTIPAQPLHIKSATPSILFEDITNGYLAYIGDAQDFLTGDSPGADSFGIRSEGDIRLGTGGNNLRMTIDSNGTVKIDQDTNNFALHIDAENTTSNAVIVECDALTSNGIARFYSNSSDTTSRNLVQIVNDHASATGATGLKIVQDSTGVGLSIDQNGNGHALHIDSESTSATVMYVDAPTATTGSVFYTNPSALTSGAAIRVEQTGTALASTATGGLVEIFHTGNSSSNTNNLLFIHNDHASATGTTALKILQDSTGAAIDSGGNIFIEQTPYVNNSDHTLIGLGGNAGLHSTTAVGASGELGLAHNLKNTGSAWVTISTDEHTMYTQAGGNHNFYAWASASAGATVSEWTTSKVAIFDANSRISLSNNDAGTDNTVFGFMAGAALASGGVENTLVGDYAGTALTTGDYNTAVGKNALPSEDVGQSSTAIGYSALGSQNTGSQSHVNNVGVGVNTGYYNGTGTNNTWLGSNAGVGASGNSNSNNVGVGASSLLAVTTGSANTSIGKDSSKALTDGHNNVVIGNNALETSTSVGYVVAIGDDAMKSGNVTADADGSIAIGGSALVGLTNATGCIAIGYESLKTVSTTNHCTAIGYQAGKLITGSLNTMVGFQAADSLASGTSNTVIGARAMGSADGGEQNNVIIGTDAGDVINDDAADGNVIIGQDADPSGSAGTNQIVIGQGATGVGDNSVTLGNADVLNVYAAQDGAAHVHCSGISFPATQSASGGANTQDDYEEGDWTPVLSDGSNNATSAANTEGTYTKIGRQVTVIGRIQTSSLGSVSGTIQINGLPFTAGNDDKYKSVGNIGLGLNLNVTAGYNIDGYIPANGATLLLYINDAATGATAMTGAEWSADGHAIIQATYFV